MKASLPHSKSLFSFIWKLWGLVDVIGLIHKLSPREQTIQVDEVVNDLLGQLCNFGGLFVSTVILNGLRSLWKVVFCVLWSLFVTSVSPRNMTEKKSSYPFPALSSDQCFVPLPSTDCAETKQRRVWNVDRSSLTISNFIWYTAELMQWLDNLGVLIQFKIPHIFSECTVEPVIDSCTCCR